MISVFQVFKIILGIIISAFILFFVLRFAGSYMDIGESSRQVSIIVSFKKSIEDVYTTGVSTDFEMKDSEILAYKPPYVDTSKVSYVDMDPIPLLLIPGEKFSIYRNEYDTGWWKFYLIEVLPETKILFVPLGNDERVWSVMGNITKFLPSTENTKTKVKFYLGCNKTEPDEYYPIGERNRLLDMVPKFTAFDVEMGPCGDLEYFREKGYRIITISEESTDADFLVSPIDNEIGYVYIKTGDGYEEYIYKNGLDIVALLLGGKRYYDYVNEKFLGELGVAIDVGIRETDLLTGDINLRNRCGAEFSEFRGTLDFIKEELIPELDSMEEENTKEFAYQMRESVEDYKSLERLGCG
jgi:hypothetical protein